MCIRDSLRDAGAVGFTDGVKAVANAQLMRRVLSYAAHVGALVVQHAEEPALATGVMNESELAGRLGLCPLYSSPSPRDRTRVRMPASG